MNADDRDSSGFVLHPGALRQFGALERLVLNEGSLHNA
jgi:hypothetical protein